MKLFWFYLAACLGSAAGTAALPAPAQPPAAVQPQAAAEPPLQGAEALMGRLQRAKSEAEADAYLTDHSAAEKSILYFSFLWLNLPLSSSPKPVSPGIHTLLHRYSLTENQINAAVNFGVIPPQLAAHGRQFLQDYLRLGIATSKAHASPSYAVLPPPASEFTFQVISPTRVRIRPLYLRHLSAKGSRVVLNKSSDYDEEARLEDGRWYLEPILEDAAPAPPKTAAAARSAAFLLALEEQDAAGVKKGLKEDPALARLPLAFSPQSGHSYLDLPLSLAVFTENREITRLLVQAKAKVNATDEEGQTPLEEAADQDDEAMASLLLAHGAKVNFKDKNGDTALHLAAVRGRPGIITLLIEDGADVNARDNNGDTPLSQLLSLPPELVNRKAVALLRRHGAKK